MRTAERLLVALVALFAAFVGVQALGARAAAAAGSSLGAGRVAAAVDSVAIDAEYVRGLRRFGSAAPPRWVVALQAERLAAPRPSAPLRDTAAARDRVTALGSRTYLPALLAANDSVLVRWPDGAGPLRVWVQPRSDAEGWTPSLVPPVRAAFHAWGTLGLGVDFVAVDDSSAADVHVLWSTYLPERGQIGSTVRVTDDAGWIAAATITLATRVGGRVRDETLDIYTVQNAALHEVGHLIGLDHSPNRDDVMATETAGRQDHLSARDRATAMLLYSLPPGRL